MSEKQKKTKMLQRLLKIVRKKLNWGKLGKRFFIFIELVCTASLLSEITN